MSYFRLRCSRFFGDFHKLSPRKSVFPDEKVEVKFQYDAYIKLDKLRKRRLWMLMGKDALDLKIKKKLYGYNEEEALVKPVDEIKDDQYYKERGLLGNDELITEFFEIDRETNLPYGLGFDETIRELKERGLAEASQDKIRDVWIKMGFPSTKKVLEAVPHIDMHESIEKIKRRIYTSRHKTEEMAYINIQNEENPVSQANTFKEVEFFSDDFSDKEASGDRKEAVRLVKKKYWNKLYVEENTSEDPEAELFSKKKRKRKRSQEYLDNRRFRRRDIHLPKFPKKPLFPDWWAESRPTKIGRKFQLEPYRKAVRLVHDKIRQKNRPVFFTNTPRGYLQSTDLDYNLKIHKGFAPTFSEVIAEAEKLIAKEPMLKKLDRRDNYEKNKHFVPRYLDKDRTPEDFVWSFLPKPETAQYPGYITGLIPFRQSTLGLIKMSNLYEQEASKGFKPDAKDLSMKVYSLVKNDPYHMHFLDNHLRYWLETVREVGKFETGGVKAAPIIPWEYIDATKPRSMKTPKVGVPDIDEEGFARADGKRKVARAKAAVRPGTGLVTINGKSLIHYFTNLVARDRVILPFIATKTVGAFDAQVEVKGGGVMGQSQAIQLAIARAFTKYFPLAHRILHQYELLLRDPRQVERKKSGRYKARKSYTWVKR